MKTAVIGGGAAGFFLAINLKEMMPSMQVTILERSHRLLSKVAVSGGGRCNCTNTFEGVDDLSETYPRGHRLMKRLFNLFNHQDAYQWFEDHGVRLVTQEDHCVFPASQDAQTIINCFLKEAHRHGIDIKTGTKVDTLLELKEYDYVAVTTGGMPHNTIASTTKEPLNHGNGIEDSLFAHHQLEQPIPSLFTFKINDEKLHALMGAVVEDVGTAIPGTKLRADGPLLVTHWGMSGPAILKLSSYAARLLYDNNYQLPLLVNWLHRTDAETADIINTIAVRHAQKLLSNAYPPQLPSRIWNYILEKHLPQQKNRKWSELGKKDLHVLTNALCNDNYHISGRATFKDEFVTCGGVSLKNINPSTMESRITPNLYFAGEVLDIDGITGGFNFQAAWTTAYCAAKSIAEKASKTN